MKNNKPKEPEDMTPEQRKKWEKLQKSISAYQIYVARPELN